MTTPTVAEGRVRLDGLRLALATDTYAPQLNGVTRTLLRLAREAAARGADVRVYTAGDPSAHPTAGVTRFPSLPFRGYPQLRLAWPGVQPLLADWGQWDPHLVHAATPFGVGIAARAAALRLGIPFVTSYHTSLSDYAKFYRLGWLSRPGWTFLRWFHNRGRRTYCPTHAIADDLRARGFTGTCVWGRGVDTAAFAPEWRSLEFRRAYGVADAEFVVLYVGRLAREKGLDQLLAAMQQLRATGQGAVLRLVLVGDGPYEAACRAGAPSGTVFTGTLSGHDLSAAFASGDLFVFPSTTDTFGNVILEAMASGVPVLAADSRVSREQVGRGRGFLFDVSVPGGLAKAIGELMVSREARLLASRAALADVAARTWVRVFDGLFSDYLQVVRGADQEHPGNETTHVGPHRMGRFRFRGERVVEREGPIHST
jgi:glycosyltransferase involved in cell wall biosynthesis